MADYPGTLARISAQELAECLRSGTSPNPQPLIIDVRDDDFHGGHIRGAVNITQESFAEDEDVDALVDRYQHQERIIFHCMMSQVRGPFCAQRFVSRMEALLENKEKKPQVFILDGGFQNFASVSLIQMDTVRTIY
jgi:rhodanese-related sulfurtransferase